MSNPLNLNRFALLMIVTFSWHLATETSNYLFAQSDALHKYVQKPDESYDWTLRKEFKVLGSSAAEITMTSQTWKDIKWQHRLFVIKPANMEADVDHAMLFITGGGWKDSYADPNAEDPVPSEARMFAALAARLGTPVAVLTHVPFQPIFDGKVEDEIIAYTFAEFMKSGDVEWPLLLPMVKSAVRAMDTVTAFGTEHWDVQLKTFTVTGASKRGWTTWLTGAVDSRVTAIAPMVIDMLNMSPQMRHQRKAWGSVSTEINDYSEQGLMEHLDTERGQQLQQIVDPYRYRQALKMPKLIMLGTNDDYWPIDALNLYWNDLQGPKTILYVPNNRHGLNDLPRITGGLNALHQNARGKFAFPKMQWEFDGDTKQIRLKLSADVTPKNVLAWSTESEDRDFRNDTWTSKPMQRDGNAFLIAMTPSKPHAALIGEAEFECNGMPFFLSTTVKVLEPSAN
ncbi:MAG: PhoPQ-activated protein PqaA family protein [Pirellulaceae bacterium]